MVFFKWGRIGVVVEEVVFMVEVGVFGVCGEVVGELVVVLVVRDVLDRLFVVIWDVIDLRLSLSEINLEFEVFEGVCWDESCFDVWIRFLKFWNVVKFV